MEKTIASHQPTPVEPARLAEIIASLLDDEKAEEIRIIDLSGKSSFADFMVITSGRSARHVAALADKLVTTLKPMGLRVTLEGHQQCDWVLVDAGDVVVHLFRPEVRAFYDLEKMWASPSKSISDMKAAMDATDAGAGTGSTIGKTEPTATIAMPLAGQSGSALA